ncbi:MAG TPA: hypothetical protein VJN89_20750 [Candidatus Acidoferrum sp.]|nr:hypothetical protein [Candidatus Acidoferrum sp.]
MADRALNSPLAVFSQVASDYHGSWWSSWAMLTFLLGPFLAVLPKRWRQSLPMQKRIEWQTASMLSGFAEFLFGVAAMLYWYSYSMTTWVSRGLDAALAGKVGPNVNDQQIGFMAIFIFATHPLTWLILYVAVEGSVRLIGAAFAENNLGVLPLFVADKIFLKLTGQSAPGIAQAAGYTETNVSSYVGAIRDKVRVSRALNLPDELCVVRDGADEFLDIRACRNKPDWTPPRTVRYQDTFYRLENSFRGSEPRTYHYRLRRLSAGVMSRTVLVYAPDQEPAVSEK